MLSTTRILSRFAPIVVFVAGSGVALAGTDNAPGSMCVGAGTGKLTVNSRGEAENQSSVTVTAICPSERAISPSTTQFSGAVFVRDQSSSGDICCRMMTKNPGGAVVTGTQVCSTGNSSGYQLLSPPAITDPYTFSHVYIECTVPPPSGGLNSAILTYRTIQS